MSYICDTNENKEETIQILKEIISPLYKLIPNMLHRIQTTFLAPSTQVLCVLNRTKQAYDCLYDFTSKNPNLLQEEDIKYLIHGIFIGYFFASWYATNIQGLMNLSSINEIKFPFSKENLENLENFHKNFSLEKIQNSFIHQQKIELGIKIQNEEAQRFLVIFLRALLATALLKIKESNDFTLYTNEIIEMIDEFNFRIRVIPILQIENSSISTFLAENSSILSTKQSLKELFLSLMKLSTFSNDLQGRQLYNNLFGLVGKDLLKNANCSFKEKLSRSILKSHNSLVFSNGFPTYEFSKFNKDQMEICLLRDKDLIQSFCIHPLDPAHFIVSNTKEIREIVVNAVGKSDIKKHYSVMKSVSILQQRKSSIDYSSPSSYQNNNKNHQQQQEENDQNSDLVHKKLKDQDRKEKQNLLKSSSSEPNVHRIINKQKKLQTSGNKIVPPQSGSNSPSRSSNNSTSTNAAPSTPTRRQSSKGNILSSQNSISTFNSSNQLPDHSNSGSVTSLVSHPCDPYYLSGNNVGDLYLWLFHSPDAILKYKTFQSSITKIRFNSSGSKFGFCDQDGNLALFRFCPFHSDSSKVQQFSNAFWNFSVHSKRCADFVFLNHGSWIATVGLSKSRRNVCVWDVLLTPTRSLVCSFVCHEDGGASSVVYSSKFQLLISGGRSGDIFSFDLNEKKKIHELTKAHTANVQTLCLDPSENILFSGSTDGNIKCWSLPNLELLHTWTDAHEQHRFVRPELLINPGSAVSFLFFFHIIF